MATIFEAKQSEGNKNGDKTYHANLGNKPKYPNLPSGIQVLNERQKKMQLALKHPLASEPVVAELVEVSNCDGLDNKPSLATVTLNSFNFVQSQALFKVYLIKNEKHYSSQSTQITATNSRLRRSHIYVTPNKIRGNEWNTKSVLATIFEAKQSEANKNDDKTYHANPINLKRKSTIFPTQPKS